MYVDEVIMKCYPNLCDSEVLSLSKHTVMKRFANTLNLNPHRNSIAFVAISARLRSAVLLV